MARQKGELTMNEVTMGREKSGERTGEGSRRLCLCTCSCCGFENPEGSRRCQACGGPLIVWDEILCPVCGAELMADSVYCSQCGTKL